LKDDSLVSLPLSTPDPEPQAQPEQALTGELVKLTPETQNQLDTQARDFILQLTRSEVHSEPFESRISAIHNLGNREIREAANVTNRILNRPVKEIDEQSEVGRALVELRNTIESLDPTNQRPVQRKLLGVIPLGNQVGNYFQKYQSAQSHLDAILNALQRSEDTLRKDNATIEQEKENLWDIMNRLQQYAYLCRRLDNAIIAMLATVEMQDPEKARVVQEELLFYVRQKHQDLLTQMAVSIQGYLALDLVRKNNLELIKGIGRATTTTISALRTAVIVAQALHGQKLVLDQITALNTTTSNLIASTSALLQTQSAQIHQQAASSTIGMEQLQTAFNNIYTAMEDLTTYRHQALETMASTIRTLSTEVEKARTYLDRVRDETTSKAVGELTLPPANPPRSNH